MSLIGFCQSRISCLDLNSQTSGWKSSSERRKARAKMGAQPLGENMQKVSRHLICGVVKFIFLALFVLSTLSSQCLAGPFPRPLGYVSDYSGVLTWEQRNQLERLLGQFDKRTTVQIAVASLPVLPPGHEDINRFATDLFNAWGIGKKGKNNGVLFPLVSERRHIVIRVGLGLEKIITDEVAGRILDREVIPEFRKADYFLGLRKGIEAAIELLDGSRKGISGSSLSKPVPSTPTHSSQKSLGELFLTDRWLVVLSGLGFLSGLVGWVSMTRPAVVKRPEIQVLKVMLALLCSVVCFVIGLGLLAFFDNLVSTAGRSDLETLGASPLYTSLIWLIKGAVVLLTFFVGMTSRALVRDTVIAFRADRQSNR